MLLARVNTMAGDWKRYQLSELSFRQQRFSFHFSFQHSLWAIHINWQSHCFASSSANRAEESFQEKLSCCRKFSIESTFWNDGKFVHNVKPVNRYSSSVTSSIHLPQVQMHLFAQHLSNHRKFSHPSDFGCWLCQLILFDLIMLQPRLPLQLRILLSLAVIQITFNSLRTSSVIEMQTLLKVNSLIKLQPLDEVSLFQANAMLCLSIANSIFSAGCLSQAWQFER